MTTVAIIEGFSGGPMHTKLFRKELAAAGLTVIKKAAEADVIVAHSAGIYGVPVRNKAKLLMLIGPTYWPGQNLIKRVFKHTRSGRRFYVASYGWKFYLWRKLLEAYYFFRRHRYMWLGIKHNNSLSFLERPGPKIILVRNSEDPFCSPRIRELVKGNKSIRFVELPGIHEDYTHNPKPYIDLLLEEL